MVVDLERGRRRMVWTTVRVVAGIAGPPEQNEQITIGADIWVNNGTRPASMRWLHLRRAEGSAGLPDDANPAAMLERLLEKGAELRSTGQDTVRDVPTDRYAVTMPRTVTTTHGSEFVENGFDVWVDADNLVRRVVVVTKAPALPEATPPLPARAIDTTMEFFDFGVQEEIEPPPADQVLELPSANCASPTTPASGVVPACPTDPGAPTAQAPPPVATPKRSTLQFRPVLAVVPGACQPVAEQPDPTQPILLPTEEDNCYDLGPSELTVTKARVEATTSPDGSSQLDVALDEGDAASLDLLAERHLQQQVAMVILGRVVSAPFIQQAQFNGKAQIHGLDPQTTADVVAALG